MIRKNPDPSANVRLGSGCRSWRPNGTPAKLQAMWATRLALGRAAQHYLLPQPPPDMLVLLKPGSLRIKLSGSNPALAVGAAGSIGAAQVGD